jgi:hypothetical protein
LGIVPKSNHEIVERGKIDARNTYTTPLVFLVFVQAFQ